MAYQRFAEFYDALNQDADYDALAANLCRLLAENGVPNGLVADLGCGTGEVTLRLARAGYDMIAVDASSAMLSLLRDKQVRQGAGYILLLNQNLTQLDLYGTIRAAVSTFDTFNHLNADALHAALERAALFTEPGGLLLFDVNTPYKHRQVLGNNTFEALSPLEPGLVCEWQNRYSPAHGRTDIELTVFKDGDALFTEVFAEYCHTPRTLRRMLQQTGYEVLCLLDGEDFGSPRPKSQRLLFAARKRVPNEK